MAEVTKSAPEALREAVGEMLARHENGLIDTMRPSDHAMLEALRAAHERPGAYGDEDDARQAAIARDLLEEHGEHGECLTLMVKRLVANQADPDSLPNTARELLQWVSDTVGLSAENEAIFATKLGSLVASECVSASQEVAKERDDLRAQLEVARSAETAHEAAREALAEAGVECETVAEGIRTLDLQVRTEREVVGASSQDMNGNKSFNRASQPVQNVSGSLPPRCGRRVGHALQGVTCAETKPCKVHDAEPANWQAEELADVLKRLACLGHGDIPGNSDGNVIATQALRDHLGVAWDVVAQKWVGTEPKREPQEGDEVPTAETDREWLSAIMTAACESDVLPTDWLAPILKVLQRRREGAKSWPDGRALR